jgi:type IV secretory pathway VirB2 component (pilin)
MALTPVIEFVAGPLLVVIAVTAVIRISVRTFFEEKRQHLRRMLNFDNSKDNDNKDKE